MATNRAFSMTILAAGLLLDPAPPAVAAKAGGCAAGRFVVTRGQDALGGSAPPSVLVIEGTTLTVEGACPGSGTARTRRRGTSLAAAWDQCGTAKKVRLQATARDCSAVRGTVKTRKRKARLVAMSSTCGDGVVDAGAGEQCDGTRGCAGGAQCSTTCRCEALLDCEVSGYPCSFAEVPLDVVQRSLALGQQVVERLEGGESAADAGAFLTARPDMAEVTVDGPVIGFRLAGGRPMIVDVTGQQEILPGEPSPTALTRRPAVVSPNLVVGDGPQKHGLVLSPFRYEPELGNVGEDIAAALRTVRGYEGNVNFLGTLDEHAPQVTVDTLTRLDDYDVVHIDTHGGTLCKKKEEALPGANAGDDKKCVDGVTDFLVQRFHGTAEDLRSIEHPGVVHYRGRVHQSIAVTADFFRHYYPQGLSNTVFILGSCNTFRDDLAGAIAGRESIFMSWERSADSNMVRTVGLSLMESFGRGLTVSQAAERIPPLTTPEEEAVGSRFLYTERLAGGDLRIRDLPRLLDPETRETLLSGLSLEIIGETDDGEPDRLRLLLDVDGIPESEPFRVVSVLVNGASVAAGPIGGFAEPDGPWSWAGEPEIDLGFDVQEGQPVDIVVRVTLPEGGVSEFAVTPTLSGPGFEPGRLWQGTFTKWDGGLTSRTIVVTALFERDPDDGPTDTHPRFRLKSGTMTWSLSDEPGDCVYSAPTTVTPLGPDEDSSFKFDLTKQPVEYSGKAETTGPLVELVRECPGPTGSVTTVTEAGGRWFNVPIDGHFVAGSDQAIAGEFSFGFGQPHLWTWSLMKIE